MKHLALSLDLHFTLDADGRMLLSALANRQDYESALWSANSFKQAAHDESAIRLAAASIREATPKSRVAEALERIAAAMHAVTAREAAGET